MSNFSTGYSISSVEFLQTTMLAIPPQHYLLVELSALLAGTEHLTIGDKPITGKRGLAELFVVSHGYTVLIFPTLADKQIWNFQKEPLYDHHMDCNGVEIASPGGDPALVPGIPPVMREWLTRYGVLNLAGIAKLRPYKAGS